MNLSNLGAVCPSLSVTVTTSVVYQFTLDIQTQAADEILRCVEWNMRVYCQANFQMYYGMISTDAYGHRVNAIEKDIRDRMLLTACISAMIGMKLAAGNNGNNTQEVTQPKQNVNDQEKHIQELSEIKQAINSQEKKMQELSQQKHILRSCC